MGLECQEWVDNKQEEPMMTMFNFFGRLIEHKYANRNFFQIVAPSSTSTHANFLLLIIVPLSTYFLKYKNTLKRYIFYLCRLWKCALFMGDVIQKNFVKLSTIFFWVQILSKQILIRNSCVTISSKMYNRS